MEEHVEKIQQLNGSSVHRSMALVSKDHLHSVQFYEKLVRKQIRRDSAFQTILASTKPGLARLALIITKAEEMSDRSNHSVAEWVRVLADYDSLKSSPGVLILVADTAGLVRKRNLLARLRRISRQNQTWAVRTLFFGVFVPAVVSVAAIIEGSHWGFFAAVAWLIVCGWYYQRELPKMDRELEAISAERRLSDQTLN